MDWCEHCSWWNALCAVLALYALDFLYRLPRVARSGRVVLITGAGYTASAFRLLRCPFHALNVWRIWIAQGWVSS
jgi:hypothetical protein